LAKTAKLHTRKLRIAAIWNALVRYANAGLHQDASVAREERAFEELVLRSLGWINGDTAICHDLEHGERMEILASLYRSEVRRVLKWLADPVTHRDLAIFAVDFLRLHGTAIEINVAANSGYDVKKSPILVFDSPTACRSVMSPVCRFILDQINRYDEGDEKQLSKVFPIALCERPECIRFMVVERAGKRFCSDSCRALSKQAEMTAEENAARMRKYRAGLKEMSRKPIRIAKRREQKA
jgi:hypothetical protein